jgi:hypothetical protein
MRWCARCGAPIDDGLLLCGKCVPREKLIQDVKIIMTSPITMVVGMDGKAAQNIPGKGKSTVKAYEASDKGGRRRSRLRVVEKIEWIHDRQREERIVRLFDHRNRLYSETCFDLETGAITWGPKYENLDNKKGRDKRS